MRKFLRIIIWVVLLLVAVIAVLAFLNRDMIQRVAFGGLKVYETTPPEMPADIPRPAILVFNKTNGFRHTDALPAADALFKKFASENGWGHFQTDNGATFSADILSRFDAVVFNNVSGDVFTPDQRKALKDFIENGGGFLAFHGSGGDMSYDWRWYVDELIGAQFIGHTMNPQFAEATMHIEDKSHPATADLPDEWVRTEELYSFDNSVRAKGYNVLVTVDEKTYDTEGLMGKDLAMGDDHPMVWWHCQGKGRSFYSALGHQASAYAEPNYQKLLLGATNWVLRNAGEGCDVSAPTDVESTGVDSDE